MKPTDEQLREIVAFCFADFEVPKTVQLNAWVSVLREYPLDVLHAGAKKFIKRKHFGGPKLGEFCEVLDELTAVEKMSGFEALKITRSAIQKERFGREREVLNGIRKENPELFRFLTETNFYFDLKGDLDGTTRSVLHSRFLKAWEEFQDKVSREETRTALGLTHTERKLLDETTQRRSEAETNQE